MAPSGCLCLDFLGMSLCKVPSAPAQSRFYHDMGLNVGGTWCRAGEGQVGTCFPHLSHQDTRGALPGGLKCDMAKNFMEKVPKEEPGLRDVMYGFALCHGGRGRRDYLGWLRLQTDDFVSNFPSSISCLGLNYKESWDIPSQPYKELQYLPGVTQV